jgi:hypothetical protein
MITISAQSGDTLRWATVFEFVAGEEELSDTARVFANLPDPPDGLRKSVILRKRHMKRQGAYSP